MPKTVSLAILHSFLEKNLGRSTSRNKCNGKGNLDKNVEPEFFRRLEDKS